MVSRTDEPGFGCLHLVDGEEPPGRCHHQRVPALAGEQPARGPDSRCGSHRHLAGDTDDDSRLFDAPRAVAAAALIAAQCRGGTPVDPNYGPSTPMPQFPAYLRDLAIEALQCG